MTSDISYLTTSIDKTLADIYRNTVSLNNIYNISSNTLIDGGLTILSTMYISNNSFLSNDTTMLSNLNISNKTIINNAFVCNIINGTACIFNNNICNSMLTINNYNTNTLVCVNKLSVLNTFTNNIYINDSTTILSNLYCNKYINTSISILSPTINIGNVGSLINIKGSLLNEHIENLLLVDKLVTLNGFSTSSNIGSNAGFEIIGYTSTGYIKTSSDAKKYQIKSPIDDNINDINILDSNNNSIITGKSLLYNTTTINSKLYITSYSIFNSDVSTLSDMYCNNAFINSNCNIYGNLNINNTTLYNDNLSILSNLYSNNINVFNATINSNLLIYNNTVINNNISLLSSLAINSTSNNILYNLTTYSDINLNNIITNNFSIQNLLYCSTNSIFNKDTTFNSSLYISGLSQIKNTVNILNNINCSGNTTIYNNITLLSDINSLGNIACILKEYPTNSLATANGIPLWGFYRTGGIVKVRLDNISPEIVLNGLTYNYLQLNSSYIDLGVTVTDNITSNIIPYIVSILNNNIEILSNILVANTSNNISSLLNTSVENSYTIIYKAIDSEGNAKYKYRYLYFKNFVNNIISYSMYNSSSIINNISNNNYNLITSNNFTIECWINIPQNNIVQRLDIFNFLDSSIQLSFSINNNGLLCIYFPSTNTTILLSAVSVRLNTWNHIVWMRYNNMLYSYINGIISTSINIPSELTSLTGLNKLSIGLINGSISQPIVYSSAKYSTTNIIPSYDLSPTNNINVLYLLNNNMEVISTTNISGVYNISSRSTSKYKISYKTSLGYFGPVNNTYNFGSSWTYEAWIYQSSRNSNSQILVDFRDSISRVSNPINIICFTVNSSGYPQLWIPNTNSYITPTISTNIKLLEWTHIVLSYSNGILNSFINGIKSDNVQINLNINMSTLVISSWDTNKFNGYISQMALYKSIIYSSSFIPSFDITPININSNILLFVDNQIDNITSTYLTYNSTSTDNYINYRYLLDNNIIINNINDKRYVDAYNFNTGWLGPYIKDFTNVFNGSNNYTVEMWVYLTAQSDQGQFYLIDFRDPVSWDTSSGTSGWLGSSIQNDLHTNKIAFTINNNGQLVVWYGNIGNLTITNQTINYNTWNHIVWMKSNMNYYGIINGYCDGTVITNNESNNLTNLYSIILGRAANNTSVTGNYKFNGYMSQVLIRSDVCYDINTPFVPSYNLSDLNISNKNTVFYLNNNYNDNASNISLPVRFSVPILSRYISYIHAYDTTNGMIGPLSNNFNSMNNTNWTIECWVYQSNRGTTAYSLIGDFRNIYSPATNNIFGFGIKLNGKLCIVLYNYTTIEISNDVVPLNTWVHVVWSKQNNILYGFINGVNNYSIECSNYLNELVNVNYILVGGSADQVIPNTRSYQFYGQISQLKISLGFIYDSYVTFIPNNDLSYNINDTICLFLLHNNLIDIITNIQLTRKYNITNRFRLSN